MNRSAAFVLIGTLAVVLSACVASGGGLGPVPSAVPTPSGSPAGPDLTPVPGESADPSTSPTPTPGSSGSPSPTASPAPTAAPGSGNTIVRAYFVLGGEPRSEGLVPVLREVPETTSVARAAMNALLGGPTASESGERTVTSAIPDGSRLLGIDIKNGIATVDLSTEFDSGGGSASMQYRLAQVVYTLTQFSTIKSVVFQIEGTTVTVFGSEGIVLAGPVGRGDFTDQLPSIFVDRPA
ncbi:MAG: GerMN domain-containing protein, partial [Chloroflexi bacterium]|nr:GerMN domain-containing protein [Chloroflexota bacterium]